jgi:hypothetical protein
VYVVRLNISLSFSSFLASADECHMQNMEPGIQRLLEHVLLHQHIGHFLLLTETVNRVLFVCVVYFVSLELFGFLNFV